MLNQILLGDCIKVLPTLPAGFANLILTDPPYMVSYKPHKNNAGQRVYNDDNNSWLTPAFSEMHRVLADGAFCVTFYGWKDADEFLTAYRAAWFRVVGHFVFPKRYTAGIGFVRYQHECAHLLAKGNPWVRDDTIGDVIDWTYSGNKLHPTQKPISVLMQLIEAFSAPGDRVLDPFAGSGSTLFAAGMLGRRWLGIEIDERCYSVASTRLNETLLRPPLTTAQSQSTVSAGASE